MNAYIPTRKDLEDIVSKSVEESIKKALPGAIRKATRKKWLRTDDVMEILQCSRRHVQYLRDSEQLPFSQNGRTIIYDIDEVEAYLNIHKVSHEDK